MISRMKLFGKILLAGVFTTGAIEIQHLIDRTKTLELERSFAYDDGYKKGKSDVSDQLKIQCENSALKTIDFAKLNIELLNECKVIREKDILNAFRIYSLPVWQFKFNDDEYVVRPPYQDGHRYAWITTKSKSDDIDELQYTFLKSYLEKNIPSSSNALKNLKHDGRSSVYSAIDNTPLTDIVREHLIKKNQVAGDYYGFSSQY